MLFWQKDISHTGFKNTPNIKLGQFFFMIQTKIGLKLNEFVKYFFKIKIF